LVVRVVLGLCFCGAFVGGRPVKALFDVTSEPEASSVTSSAHLRLSTYNIRTMDI